MVEKYDPQALQKQEYAYTEADISDAPYLYLLQQAQRAAELTDGRVAALPDREAAGEPEQAYTPVPGAVPGRTEPGFRTEPTSYMPMQGSLPQRMPNEGRGDFGGPGRNADDLEFESFMTDTFGFLQDPFSMVMMTPLGLPISLAGKVFGFETPAAPPTSLFDLGFLATQALSNAFSGRGDFIGEAQATQGQPGFGISATPSGYLVDTGLGGARGGDTISGGYGQDTLGGPSHSDTFGGGRGGRGGGDAGSGGGGGGAGTGGCFVAGSGVLMADGGLKRIEDIRIGDAVMAFEGDGELEPRRVIGTYSKADKPAVRLNGLTVCTRDHRFYCLQNGKWDFVPLEEILIGADLMGPDGDKVPVTSIEDVLERHDVYNFTVEGLHTYVVNGYRVHNEK